MRMKHMGLALLFASLLLWVSVPHLSFAANTISSLRQSFSVKTLGSGYVPACSDGLDFRKGVTNIDLPFPPGGIMDYDAMLAPRLDFLAGLGVDIVAAAFWESAVILASPSNESGKALRANGQKIWVPFHYLTGGLLSDDIGSGTDPDGLNLTFLSAGNRYGYFNDYAPGKYYSNLSFKTIWIGGECMQFNTMTRGNDYIGTHGKSHYNMTFHIIQRGCNSTTPTAHVKGSIPINKELLTSLMRYFSAPERRDAIAGYYLVDETDFFFPMDYTEMSQLFNDTIRAFDPDPSHLLINAQMGYFASDTNSWFMVPGTTNYTNVDAVENYIYPWTLQGSYLGSISKQYNRTRFYGNYSRTPKIYGLVQALGSDVYIAWPTDEQLWTEIGEHIRLGANGIMFYSYNGVSNASNNYSGVIRAFKLSNFSANFSYLRYGTGLSFNASPSCWGSGPILDYKWNFGDGSTGSGPYPQHHYGSPGTYSVRLETSNSRTGESAAATMSVEAYSCNADGVCDPAAETAEFCPSDCGASCGNSIVEAGEQCDGTNNTKTCGDYGFNAGYVGCYSNCTVDTARCIFQQPAPQPPFSSGPSLPECTSGSQKTCYNNLGECAHYWQACINGQWGACNGTGAVKETCDGRDNDCDGLVDDSIPCQCVFGESRPCGSSVGACRNGTSHCDNTGKWSGCIGEVPPIIELCNGIDDDCDGAVDNDCTVPDDARCADGAVPENGCFCGESLFTGGYCYGGSHYFISRELPWLLVLLIAGAVLSACTAAVTWRSRRKKLTWEEVENRYRGY